MPKVLKEKIKLLPKKPGVYIFKDKNGIPIYIGKAISLKDRVSSYFLQNLPPKTERMTSEAEDIEYILTGSEKEAFILESNLIKRYRPFYNIRLKDDKSYPFIEITTRERFPRISFKRGKKIKGNRYFGPYTSAQAARATIKFIRKTFKLRGCKGKVEKYKNACLDWHIGLCSAPCIRKITDEEYRESVNEAILFLEGKRSKLLEDLKKKMEEYAKNLEFERAMVLRDEIKEIERILERQNITLTKNINEDIIVLEKDERKGCIFIFKIREGEIRERDYKILEGIEDEEDIEIILSFLTQYYIGKEDIPQKIVIEKEDIKNKIDPLFIKEVIGRGDAIKVARGKERELTILAHINAKEVLKNFTLHDAKEMIKNEEAMVDLKNTLNLDKLPRRIEGFDISTLFGKDSVASMVSFKDGAPDKSSYRRFKIRYTKGIDDFSMMYETVLRRYDRLKKEKKQFPDLILIDGGPGQLHAAKRALTDLGIQIPIISLAKKEEEIYTLHQREPIRLPKDSPSLKLLQRIRDESHRFAITYHKILRGKKITQSILDEIPGIGEKKKKALLKAFKSIDDLYTASTEEIEKIPGFGKKYAKKIVNFLHNKL